MPLSRVAALLFMGWQIALISQHVDWTHTRKHCKLSQEEEKEGKGCSGSFAALLVVLLEAISAGLSPIPLPFLFCTRAHSVEARGAGFSVSSAAAASSSLATSTQCAVQRGRLKTQRNKEINKTGNSTTEREKKKNKKHKNTKKTWDADKVINQLGHQSVQPTATATEAAPATVAAAATGPSLPHLSQRDQRDLQWSDFDSKLQNATYICR